MGFQFFIQFVGQCVLLLRLIMLPVGRAEGVVFCCWNKRIPRTAGSQEQKEKRGTDPNNFFIDEVNDKKNQSDGQVQQCAPVIWT